MSQAMASSFTSPHLLLFSPVSVPTQIRVARFDERACAMNGMKPSPESEEQAVTSSLALTSRPWHCVNHEPSHRTRTLDEVALQSWLMMKADSSLIMPEHRQRINIVNQNLAKHPSPNPG